MDEHIKAFLAYLAQEKKYSSNTLAAYQGDLSQLAAYAKSSGSPGGGEYRPINNELLLGYMRELKEKKYSQATIARKVAAAKSFA